MSEEKERKKYKKSIDFPLRNSREKNAARYEKKASPFDIKNAEPQVSPAWVLSVSFRYGKGTADVALAWAYHRIRCIWTNALTQRFCIQFVMILSIFSSF